MCTSPIIQKRGDQVMQFACGRCHECLSLRTTNYIQKYYREAMYRKSLHFVTLTYAPDHLPLKFYLVSSSGEIGQEFSPSSSKVQRVHADWHDYHNQSGLSLDNCVAFSTLNRRDVRLWIKEWRNANPGLSFSFSFIGEYGKFGRPHYHGVVFGLDDDQTRSLVSSWHRGFVDFKSVPLISGKEDIYYVSGYVSKYMHKGDFELPLVAEGLVERPRVFSSINLGLGDDFQRLKNWYLGKDRYPSVDPMDESFSDDYLDLVESRLKVFSLGGKRNQYLCKSLKQRFLTYKYYNENSQKTYRKSTNLALALADRLLVRNLSRMQNYDQALRQFFEGREDAQAQFDAAFHELVYSEQLALEDKERYSKEILHRSLSKSKL